MTDKAGAGRRELQTIHKEAHTHHAERHIRSTHIDTYSRRNTQARRRRVRLQPTVRCTKARAKHRGHTGKEAQRAGGR